MMTCDERVVVLLIGCHLSALAQVAQGCAGLRGRERLWVETVILLNLGDECCHPTMNGRQSLRLPAFHRLPNLLGKAQANRSKLFRNGRLPSGEGPPIGGQCAGHCAPVGIPFTRQSQRSLSGLTVGQQADLAVEVFLQPCKPIAFHAFLAWGYGPQAKLGLDGSRFAFMSCKHCSRCSRVHGCWASESSSGSVDHRSP